MLPALAVAAGGQMDHLSPNFVLQHLGESEIMYFKKKGEGKKGMPIMTGFRRRIDAALKSLKLAVSLAGYSRWDDNLSVQLNGQGLRGKVSGEGLLFEDVPARQGKNELTFSLRRRSPNQRQPMWVQGVELLVEYQTQTSG